MLSQDFARKDFARKDSVFKDSALKALKQTSAVRDFSLRVIRTRCHDEFERRADECRRLAAAARNDADRAFWLSLMERWQAVESRHPVLTVPRRQKPKVVLDP